MLSVLMSIAVFFNRGSVEPEGSTSSMQGFRQTIARPVKKIKLRSKS